MLYVDAGNVRAVKLYIDLGFTLNHIDRAYTGDIPAYTGDPATSRRPAPTSRPRGRSQP